MPLPRVPVPPSLVLILLSLSLLSSIPQSEAGITYAPGVRVGDWWKYGSINIQCSLYCPAEVLQLQQIRWINSTVIDVTGKSVTIENRISFTNGTMATTILSGNVETGQGNLTYAGIYYLIAGGLTQGDSIYNSPTAPTINTTLTINTVGVLRPVNFLALSNSLYTLEQGWDQEKGVLVEAEFFSIGISGTISITDSLWFHTPDFTLSISTSSVALELGETRNLTITVRSRNGFKGTIDLTATVQPQGPLLNMYPPMVDVPDYVSARCGSFICQISGSVNSTLTIFAPKDMPLGSYTARVTASNQTVSRSTTLTITVTGPDFMISAFPPSVSMQASNETVTWYYVVTINIGSQGGFAGQVFLASEVIPAGLTASFTRDYHSLQPSYPNYTLNLLPNSYNYTLLVLNSATVGSYQVTVTATSGTRHHELIIPVQVFPPQVGNFAISATPEHIAMRPNMNATSTITLTSIENFAEDIHLNAILVNLSARPGPSIGPDPFGPQVYIAPRVLTLAENESATATLTVQTPNLPIRGNYTVMIMASSRFLHHDFNVTVTVAPAPVPDTGPDSGPDADTNPDTGRGPRAASIFGLPPLLFYGITGAVLAVSASVATFLAISRRRRTPLQ